MSTAAATAIATAISPAATPNARWYPAARAGVAGCPAASSAPVREVASVAATATPAAPPACCVVLASPDATPESSGVTADITSVVTAGAASPYTYRNRSSALKLSSTGLI